MSKCSFLGLCTAKAPLNLNTYPLSQHQPHKLHIDKWKMQSFWNNQIVLAKSAWVQRLCFSNSFKTASVIPLQREYSVCASFTAPNQLLWSLCSVYSAKFSSKIKGKLASLTYHCRFRLPYFLLGCIFGSYTDYCMGHGPSVKICCANKFWGCI